MNTLTKFLLGAALIAVIALGVVAYAYLKPTENASAPIMAIPIAAGANQVDNEADNEADSETETVAESETIAEVAARDEITAAAEIAAESPITVEEEAQSTEAQNATERIIFEIVSAESEARFIVDEILNGAPKTVIGTTDQVAGQIAVDKSNPANTQLGVIQVNARTFATDSSMRNRMIQNRILSTDSYEFITFTPTSLEGWPAVATVGEPFTLQIMGDLTVRDVTRQVTFTAEVTPVSETRLQGLATTTILRSDYGLTIPQVPSVAGVDDDVILEIEFVAAPV